MSINWKRARRYSAAFAVPVLAGFTLAAVPAGAQSLPDCAAGASAADHCTTNVAGALGGILQNGGTAGYYGADDNHTHYRFVQTTVTATPELVDLNGPLSSDLYPATVGDELCDPNDGVIAQISLGYVDGTGGNPGTYEVAYTVGKYPASADPCIQNNFQNYTTLSENIFKSGSLLFLNGISPNDKVYLGIYYTPSGNHVHQLSFGACDETTGVCRQAYTQSRFQLEFWEFGIGTFVPESVLTGGADNQFETFSSDDVTCYACSAAVPVSSVSPVNSFGAGGLYENQFANSSSQLVLTPKDTLSGDTFSEFNGSASI
jgi:hypothetical protein